MRASVTKLQKCERAEAHTLAIYCGECARARIKRPITYVHTYTHAAQG